LAIGHDIFARMSEIGGSPDPGGRLSQPGLQPVVHQSPQPSTEETLVTIGDILVTRSWVVTPSGTQPVGSVTWSVSDMSTTTTNIPVWAIVCTVLFVWFFLLGLLFLLVKETKTQGMVQVTVQGPGFAHFAQIPAFNPGVVPDINARVNYARSLTAASQQLPHAG
jgi:hypothetical protein